MLAAQIETFELDLGIAEQKFNLPMVLPRRLTRQFAVMSENNGNPQCAF